MKRVPELASFCCIILGLMTSGSTNKNSGNHGTREFTVQTRSDTSQIADLLEVETFHLTIIPPSSGVQFFRNGIVFLSNTRDEGKMLPKHVSFGSNEAYTAILRDTSLGLHVLFSPSSPFSYPCEAITFSTDFKTMYFTMIGKKEKKEKIYRAVYKSTVNGETGWIKDANPAEFCAGNFIYTHPALSSDGKTMIFASDMDGTLGGLDLYVVRKEDERWSKPENLGRSINTTMYECYPFLDPDNNLYYSSNGLKGYGGYDIFTCRFNGQSWEAPVNLSQRINSGFDDIAFSIDKINGLTAFYSQRKKSPEDDIRLLKVTVKKNSTNSLLTISSVFNSKPASKPELIAAKPDEIAKETEKEQAKSVPVKELNEPKVSTKVVLKAEEKKAPPVTESKTEARDNSKVVIIKTSTPIPENLKNVIVYRIQFLSTSKPRKESQVLINGVPYNTFEYFYLGAYRYTIGEFTTLAQAVEFQNICRKSGYPQAFIAAFKDDTRSLDLKTFR